ncbi:trk system potassium uptake protein TrkH [Azospirillum fermentarium]|uniref:TrkH family potassium uptake protein n=1 Tax=Azospirillum fermentarium TaxID=1233114 RepID=UPI002227A305|nr:TrkH family potassium uptake protein [Azospirillum fermentarium]MCW2246531.1 trk system potassium uptake protein TrkH [Azospirillum fermentarium]
MHGRITFRPVFHIIGVLLTVLGLGMLIPALADAAVGNPDWTAFVGASAATLAVSGGMYLGTAGEIETISVRQTFLLTVLAWVILATFGALPFLFSSLKMDFTDAYYEAMSGLTTTGGTVIVGLDYAPPGILLWRSLLSWLGGVGIIVMAIAVLPILRVGGMQLFRTESSDKSDKPFATVADTAGGIIMTYLILTILSAVLFRVAGMNWFDAVCHAMASISTGGFSTKDSSLGFFDSHAVLWAATASIVAGAMPLTWYIRMLRNTRGFARLDRQVSAMLKILGVSIAAMTLWAWLKVGLPFWDALSHSALNVSSVITTSGFVSTDYSAWGSFAIVAFFFFFFIGGCTGSTTGSIKIFRWQVLAQSMRNQMLRMLKPRRVLVSLYNDKPLDPDVVDSVINFAFAYMASFGILALAMAALDVDFLSAASAVAAALGGAGAGLGPVVGPSGTFAPLPDAGKWLLCLAMLLGRLEVFTVLVLLIPSFWKD